MNYMDGREFLRAVAKVLGIDNMPIQKMVIVANCDDLVKVYVQALVDNDKNQLLEIADATAGAIVEVVPDIKVDLQGGFDTTTCLNEKYRTRQPRSS